jgi:hypothetical protein
MENLSNNITGVVIDNDNIVITYDNAVTETLPRTYETYKRMYDTWMLGEPVFISDKFKPTLNLLVLINSDTKYVEKINIFFVESNVENVKKFFIYMRGRKEYLAVEKLKWTKIKEDI